MAQLTWKNISTPSGTTLQRDIPIAADLFQGAFDSLDSIVENKQAIDARNFKNQTVQNDLGIQANIQQLNDLAAFNKTKPNYNIAALKKEHGVQFTPDEVKNLVTDQQNKLREKAYNVASQVGGQTADENFDVIAGGKAVEQSLISQGMDAGVAKSKANEWVQNSQMRQTEYAKGKADNTIALISTLNQAEKQPISLEEARQMVIETAKQYGNRVDIDKALTAVHRTLRDRQTDTAYAQDKKEYKRKENVRTEVNRIGAKLRQELKNTGSFTSITNTLSNIKDQDVYAQVTAKVLPGLKANAQMSQEQEIGHTRLTGDLQNQIEQITSANNNQRAILDNTWTKARGFSKETENYVTKLAVEGKNFVKAITESSQGTGWLTRVVNGKIKHNADAIRAVNAVYQKMITSEGLDEKTAQAILFQTINNNVGKNQNFLFEGEGIDTTALSKKVATNIKTYRDNQHYLNDLITFDQDMANDQRELDYQASNILLDNVELARIQNFGGKIQPIQKELFLNKSALSKYKAQVGVRKLSSRVNKDIPNIDTDTNTDKLNKAAEKIDTANSYSKLNNYTDIIHKGNYLFGKDREGLFKQILKIPRRTFYLRDRGKNPSKNVQANPKYADYLEAIRGLNIK